MSSKDLKNNIAVVHLLDSQDVNAVDTVSSILDTAGFESAGILVNVGAMTGVDANNFLDIVLQECATTVGADFTTVAAADAESAYTRIDLNTEDQASQFVGYKGGLRYIRVNLNFTDAGPLGACLVAVDGILGHPRHMPAVGPAAVTAT